MTGIEDAYCNAALNAVLTANATLLDSSISEVLKNVHVLGKGDTLGLDAKPEIAITERLKAFDQYAVIITEERGQDANPLARLTRFGERGARTFFVCDPTDRSSMLQTFLQSALDTGVTHVRAALCADDALGRWESHFSDPAVITGPFTAITCIRRGLPVCSVLLNYLTQDLFVACSAGVFQFQLPADDSAHVSLKRLQREGRRVEFREATKHESKKCVTFVGKSGYKESLLDSNLVEDGDLPAFLHYDLPGGPSRILYLSTLMPEARVGMIVANGEKLGEWVHWLPFVRFTPQVHDQGEHSLGVFELFHDRPWTKDGILMSTSPVYSIFKNVDRPDHRVVIDVSVLEAMPNPSKYRSTLMVCPSGNTWARHTVMEYGSRPIQFVDG